MHLILLSPKEKLFRPCTLSLIVSVLNSVPAE